ncbi:magnesium transporter [Salinivibrio proteolyticus]|uniref:magnesium transporter n=1 Tax=Salinivibrio proteolyticus TaxID=334715 RepID=UPI000988BCD3|nr:magnesium transporter [Salinivibrio proteolyticus]OOF30039.1 Mg2+ transporter mgtE [Salinivibrio proteolyticus]
MTVMNNTFDYATAFSTAEIVAARNAFLQYDLDKQVELLTVMPVEESMGILHHCSVAHVQHLLNALDAQGFDREAREYANHLGFIHSEAEPAKSYLSTGVFAHVKQRIGWIVGLALLGIVSGMIIAQYEDTLSQLVLLAVYMPVIAAAGGNTGSQAATLVVRALATGELRKRQWLQVMWKEARVAVFIGVAIAAVMMVRILMFNHNATVGAFALHDIAVAIALALFIQVTISTTLGGLLPIVARACHLDPAVLVSPVLASVVDISGMWIYFTVVNTYLGIGS